MDISRLRFTSFKGLRDPATSHKHYGIGAIYDGPVTWGRSIGIDPGVNYGLTEIYGEIFNIYWGTLPSRTEPGQHGIDAFEFMHGRYLDISNLRGIPAIVEGAAFNKRFGQVGLEEVRFGFFFGLYRAGIDVHIVPPATIRKRATGSGKDKAFERWPLLNHNAADSIYIAIAALEGQQTDELQ